MVFHHCWGLPAGSTSCPLFVETSSRQWPIVSRLEWPIENVHMLNTLACSHQYLDGEQGMGEMVGVAGVGVGFGGGGWVVVGGEEHASWPGSIVSKLWPTGTFAHWFVSYRANHLKISEILDILWVTHVWKGTGNGRQGQVLYDGRSFHALGRGRFYEIWTHILRCVTVDYLSFPGV